MKPVTLGLVVAAAACAASTVYFWTQLNEERDRAAQVAETAKRLQARVTELEKTRADFAGRRMAGGGVFGGGALAQGGPGPVTMMAPPPAEVGASVAEEGHAAPFFRVDHSPAMQRMMRAQIRANNKRVYGDLAQQLGLSKDDANKLYDLLTDQQTSMMDRMRNYDDNEERPRFDDFHREQTQQLTELLGADKAQAFADYEETLPARGEVDMIARQLEGSDASLNDDQRKKLVAAFSEERKRVPPPEYVEGMDSEQYSKAMNDWQDNYNERTTDRAKSILNSEQQTAYNEYQQWQSEMRQQIATMGPAPQRIRVQGGGAVAGGTAVYQAGPSVVISDTIVNAAPLPASEKPKSR